MKKYKVEIIGSIIINVEAPDEETASEIAYEKLETQDYNFCDFVSTINPYELKEIENEQK